MKVNDGWEIIRLANEKYLQIPPEVSDYIAIQDVLRLCTFGLTNKTIGERLRMYEGYIQDTLRHYFEFTGWEEGLDFNPYFTYQKAHKKFEAYKTEVELTSAATHFDFILSSYLICKIFDDIDEKVNDYYNKEVKNG